MTDSNFTSVSRRPAQHYLTENVQMPNCPKINNWAAVWKQYLCDESVCKQDDQLLFKIIPPDTSTCDTVTKSNEVTLSRIKKNDVELKNKEKHMPINVEELFDRIKNSSENTSKKLENLEYENMKDNIHLSDKSCDLNKKRNKTKIHIDENIEKVTQDEVLSDSREMITQDEVLSDSCEMVNYSNKEILKQEKKITKTVCSVESSVSNTTYILTHLKHSKEKINIKVKDNKAVNNDLKKLKFSKPTQKVCNGAQLKGNNKIQLKEVFPKGSNNINKFRSFIPVFKRGILPKTYPSLNKQKSTVEPNPASNKVQILLVENVDMKDSNQIIRNQHSKQVDDKTKNSVPIKADINDRITDEKRLNNSVYESKAYSGLPLVLIDRNECTKFINQLSKNSTVKSNEEHCISDLTYIVKSSEKIREVVQNTDEIRKNVQKSITENSITTKLEACNFSSAPLELTNNQHERTNDSVFNISGNTFIIECDGNLKENKELIGSKILTPQKPVKTFTSSLRKYRDSQSQSDESEFIKISKNQYMLSDNDDIEDHIFFSKEKNKENQISNRSILDEKRKLNGKLSLKKNLDAREIDLNCVGVSNKTNIHNIANSRSSKENRTFGHSQRENISLNLYTNQKNESYEKPLASSKIKTENINNNTLTSNVEKKRGQQFCLDESDSIFDIKDDRRQNQKLKSNAGHISKSRVSEKGFEFETNISGNTYVKKHSQPDSDYLDIINLSDSSDYSICVTETIPSRLENSVKKKSDLENNTYGGTYILENRTRIDKPDLNFKKKLRSSSSSEPSNSSTDNSDFISAERNLKSKHIAEKKLYAIESNGSQSTYLIEPGSLSKEKKKSHGSDINSSILSHKSATMSNVLNDQFMYQIDVPVMVHSSFLGEIDQKATCSNHQRVQKTDKEKVDRNTKAVFEEPSKSTRFFDTRKSPRLNIKSNASNLVQGVDRNNETVSEASSSTNGFNSTYKKLAVKSFKSDTSFFKRLHFSTIDSDEDEDLENFVIDMCNKRKTESISKKTRGTINKNTDVFKIPHRPSLKSIYKKRSSVYTGKKSIHSNGFQMTKDKNELVKNYFVAKTNRQNECSTSRINSDIGNSMRRNIVNCFSTNVDKNNKSDLKRVTGRLTSFVSKRNGKRNPMDADKSSSSIEDHDVCPGSKQFSDGTFSPHADSATTFLSEQIKENIRTDKSLNLEKRSNAGNSITGEKHPINFSSQSDDSFSGHTYILDKNGSQNYKFNTVSAINESNDRTREEGFKKLSSEEKGLHKNIPKNCQLKRLEVSLTRIDDLSVNKHVLETERNQIYKIESNTKTYTDPPWLVSREHDDRSKNIDVKNNNNCESVYQKSIEVSDKNSSMLDESFEMSNCTLDNSDIIIRSSKKDKTKSKSRKTTDLTRECSEIDFNDFPPTKKLIDKHPNTQPSIEKRIEITNRSRTDEKKITPSEHDENTSSEERIVDGRIKNRCNVIRHLNFDRECTSTPNAGIETFLKHTRHDNADRRSESSNRESSLDKISDLSQNSIKETDKNSQEYQNGHLCISNVSHNLESTDATIISSHVLPLQERITPIAADVKFQSDIHTDSGSDSEIIFRSSNIVTPKIPMSDSHTRMHINNNSNRSSKSHKSSVKARKSKLVRSETKNICSKSDLNIGSETRTKNPDNFIDRDASKDTEIRENISESPNKYVTPANSLSPITNNECDRFTSNAVFMLNNHNSSESEQFSIDEMSEVPRLKSRVKETSSSSIHNSPGTNDVCESEAITTSSFPFIIVDQNECTKHIDRFSNKSAAKSNEEHFIRTCASPANSAQCDRASGRTRSLSNTISKRIERSKDDYHFKEPYIVANENSHKFMELNPSKCIEQTRSKPYNSNRFLDKVSFSSGYGTSNSNDMTSVRSMNTSEKSTGKRSQNREPAYGLVKDAETNRSTSSLNFSKFFSTHGDASNEIDSSWTDDGSLEINVSTEPHSNVHVENSHRDTAMIPSESSRTESPKVIKRARKNTKEPYVPTHNYNTRCKVKATKCLENSNINKQSQKSPESKKARVKKTESSKTTNTKTRTRSLKTEMKETNTNKNKVQPEEPTMRLKRKLYSRHLESSPLSLSPVVHTDEKKREPVVVPEDGKDNEISPTSALGIEYLRELKIMIDSELDALYKKSSNSYVPHSTMDPRTNNDPTNLPNTPLSTIITQKIIQSKQSQSCKLNKISERARKLDMTFY